MENRLGHIHYTPIIFEDINEGHRDAVFSQLALIPIRVEFLYVEQVFSCLAYSPLFDVVSKNGKTPEYELIMSVVDGGVKVTAKRKDCD